VNKYAANTPSDEEISRSPALQLKKNVLDLSISATMISGTIDIAY